MANNDVDVLVVDSAHGHSRNIVETVREISLLELLAGGPLISLERNQRLESLAEMVGSETVLSKQLKQGDLPESGTSFVTTLINDGPRHIIENGAAGSLRRLNR